MRGGAARTISALLPTARKHLRSERDLGTGFSLCLCHDRLWQSHGRRSNRTLIKGFTHFSKFFISMTNFVTSVPAITTTQGHNSYAAKYIMTCDALNLHYTAAARTICYPAPFASLQTFSLASLSTLFSVHFPACGSPFSPPSLPPSLPSSILPPPSSPPPSEALGAPTLWEDFDRLTGNTQ